ncbi:EAL domain-containing protein [Palleronia abyssalis]|uniref:Cyclic di-GMP phosphodiesterase YfgF n=1 Tax=Palleronia abyssalis TaxID=1501240 RepID=A0A2R8BTU0_9RHOB|nr:EAL domain-containing protein [Palleronia abyssalis]SPJ23548.1 Cyclic di-GMP phosphodiesterase YfgF [Palleronia abyssalis]
MDRRTESATADPLEYAVAERDSKVLDMVESAVDAGRVMLAFQPVVMAGRDEPVFYEGLARIMDTTGRIIPAREFILDVEETELGRRIDAISLELGLQALRERPSLRLAVNLSARSVEYPLWLAALEQGLASDPTLAERLILEITESSAITVPRLVSRFIDRLQAMGICFAIDDFGSGYTSMRYLKDFCFDILKIDGEFCHGVADKPDNQALVRAIVSIAQHFDMVTVAEGVEAAQDARALMEMGVDCLQGYYLGAPTVRPAWQSCARDIVV